jgi:hypothetical protein
MIIIQVIAHLIWRIIVFLIVVLAVLFNMRE